jgi:F-type H+-transporting ATPase subunit c
MLLDISGSLNMIGTAWIGFAIVEALAIIGIALAFVLR